MNGKSKVKSNSVSQSVIQSVSCSCQSNPDFNYYNLNYSNETENKAKNIRQCYYDNWWLPNHHHYYRTAELILASIFFHIDILTCRCTCAGNFKLPQTTILARIIKSTEKNYIEFDRDLCSSKTKAHHPELKVFPDDDSSIAIKKECHLKYT